VKERGEKARRGKQRGGGWKEERGDIKRIQIVEEVDEKETGREGNSRKRKSPEQEKIERKGRVKETGENSQKGNHRVGIDRQKGWGHRETWEAERVDTEGRLS
jgi:hypothetical protein